MNVKLLRKIQKMILAHPEHFDMSKWYGYGEKQGLRIIVENNGTKDIINFNDPGCGTTACIAGWALALDPASRKLAKKVAKICLPHIDSIEYRMEQVACSRLNFSFLDAGAEALGLNDDQAERLFLTYKWPQEFYFLENYKETTTPQLASDRIDYFIESGGY